MAESVWEYFEERCEECRALGLPVENASFYEREGTEGKRGRLFMSLPLSKRAELKVSELVTCHGSHITRDEYAYYLIIDGQEYRAWDRDATHGYHSHGLGHQRYPAARITFKAVVRECWEILSAEEWLEDAIPDAPDADL